MSLKESSLQLATLRTPIAINTATPPPNPSSALANQPGDYHIYPLCHILNIELLSAGERVPDSGPGFDGALPSISKVDLEAVKAREEATIRKIKEKDAMKGRGVSRKRKRFSTRWTNVCSVYVVFIQ